MSMARVSNPAIRDKEIEHFRSMQAFANDASSGTTVSSFNDIPSSADVIKIMYSIKPKFRATATGTARVDTRRNLPFTPSIFQVDNLGGGSVMVLVFR